MFFFVSTVVDPPMVIYMGKDKYENEELLKYGFPEDIWFHVDKVSSAHVYLRLPKGGSIDQIPKDVLLDCAQLVKANSIQGCKLSHVSVVYTSFSNLKKTPGMDVGQVGFHDAKQVRTTMVEKKLGDVLNRLNGTREERHPDLRTEWEERDMEERRELREKQEDERRQELEKRKHMKAEEEIRTYKALMVEDNMKSNEARAVPEAEASTMQLRSDLPLALKFSDDTDYKAVEEDFM